MDIELTISGLCILILKSKEDRPTQPSAVEILCVDAPGHVPRLSFWPSDIPTSEAPDLLVDPKGRQLASLNLHGRVLDLDFADDYKADFSVQWGSETVVPENETLESWMNWIPSVQEIGLKALRPLPPGSLPEGASARLTLPPGALSAKNIVRDPEGKILVWKFPAKRGLKRAIANNIVYKALEIGEARFSGSNQKISSQMDGVLEICLSTDMEKVPTTFTAGVAELDHLSDLSALSRTRTEKAFRAPKLSDSERTGRPICNQYYFVDKS